MSFQRPGRVVVAGFALLCGLSFAQAGDVFKSHCDSKSERVTLPSREVVVEQDRPRVTVRETTARVRTRATAVTTMPVLGTVYMPMAVPMFGMGRDVEAPRGLESSSLAAASRAIMSGLEHEHARALLRAEIETSKRALQRASASPDGADCASTDFQKDLNDIKAQIKQLSERMADVERLLIYHDNYLQKKIKAEAMPPASAEPMNKPNGME